MKLIDILNLIAKGELEEGTKIRLFYSDEVYELYRNELIREDKTEIFETYTLDILKEEVKIIGKDTNAANKIEELTLEKSDLACQGIHADNLFRNIECKLNEVIRELNRRSE